jgi:hypothetical protein
VLAAGKHTVHDEPITAFEGPVSTSVAVSYLQEQFSTEFVRDQAVAAHLA